MPAGIRQDGSQTHNLATASHTKAFLNMLKACVAASELQMPILWSYHVRINDAFVDALIPGCKMITRAR